MSADAFGYIGAVMIAILALPQLRKTVIGGHTEGVSALSWALQAGCSMTFLIYGIRIDSHPQIVGNVLPVLGAVGVLTATLLARRIITPARTAGAIVAAASYFAMLLLAVPPLAVGGIAVVLAAVCRLPQARESVQTMARRAPSSVARTTWVLTIIGMSSWMVYAVLAVDIPVIAANVIGLAASVTVLAAETINSRNARVAALAVTSA